MRRITALLTLILLIGACGGGSGGGGGSNPPAQPSTLYVRSNGSDDNKGLSPDTAFRSIERAVRDLTAGDVVYVGAGNYKAPEVAPGEPRPTAALDILDAPGTANQPVQLLADVTGEHTGDAGEVVIDGKDVAIGLRISRSSYVIIDGFGIERGKGNNGAGLQVRNLSNHITVRNCIVTDNIDGIRVESSTDVLVFNNLIYENSGRGIRVSGAQRTQIFNNTIANNQGPGVAIGGANAQGIGSTECALRNNVIQDNSNVSIAVDDGPPTSLTGYSGNFNLVFYADLADQTKTYRPTTIVGDHDINLDADFRDTDGIFALDQLSSPAVDAGTSTIDAALLAMLFGRSTSPDGAVDIPPVDLGYHAR